MAAAALLVAALLAAPAAAARRRAAETGGAQFSSLWGESGELYDPAGPLFDYSYAGEACSAGGRERRAGGAAAGADGWLAPPRT